jgi:hypothetical protein
MRIPVNLLKYIFNTATLWAVILVLIGLAVMISTTDTSPVWIYQGF